MKLFTLAFLFSIKVFAQGGWVSSGGELIKDARNPWFVKNTVSVKWCLQVDPKSISINETQISEAVVDALAYWKDEFTRASLFGTLPGSFALGTQVFTKVSCSDPQLDLRIIFGSSLLTPEEIKHLKDPNQFIGVTVRTDYDAVLLKGKGFIFFSGDVGGSAKSPLLENVWMRGKILRYAMMHELGHVFGLPHVGGGLMSEIFLDQIMKPEYISKFESAPFDSFLTPNPNFSDCSLLLTAATREFFGLPPGHNCLVVSSLGNGWDLKISSNKDGVLSTQGELGTVRLESPDLQDISGKPVSFLHLTEDQTVFTAKERAFRLFMVGPMTSEYGAKGKFTPAKPGPFKTLYARIGPQNLNIVGGLANGKTAPILQYNSPLSLIYLIAQ